MKHLPPQLRDAIRRLSPFPQALSALFRGQTTVCREKQAETTPSVGGEASPGHGSLFDTLKDCADLLTQLEEMQGTLDESARPLAEHLRVTVEEIIERAGGVRIEDEDAFDVTRHQPHPMKRTASGAKIAETLSVGYSFQGRVIKRARVRVEAA